MRKKSFFKKMIDYFNENLGANTKEKERTAFLKQLRELETFEHGYENLPQKLIEKFENDKDFVLDFLKDNNTYIEFGGEETDGEPSYIHEVIMLNRLSPELRNDKDVALNAIKADCRNIYYISNQLKNDKEFILKAINIIDTSNKFYADYISSEDGKKSNYLYFLDSLSKKFKNDKDIALAMVKQDFKNIEYISNRLKDNKDIVMTAIKNDGGALHFVSNRLKDNKDVVMEAIKNYNFFTSDLTLKSVSERLKNDKDVVMEAIKANCGNLQLASNKLKDDKEIILEAIKRDSSSLKWASDRLKDDKDFILKIINSGELRNNFKFVSNRLKDDKDVVLKAIKDNGSSLEYASNRLKDDKDVVMTAIKISGGQFIRYASEKLKNDKEIVIESLKYDYHNFSCIGDEIKEKYFSFVKNDIDLEKSLEILEKEIKGNNKSEKEENPTNPWTEKLKKDKDNELER